MQYFSDRVTDEDNQVLNAVNDLSSKVQQVYECCVLPVALRQWSSLWQNERVSITVNSDNFAAITLVTKLQTSSPALSIIAREMAMNIALSVYALDICKHEIVFLNFARNAYKKCIFHFIYT